MSAESWMPLAVLAGFLLARRLGEVPRGQILVYCASGQRSPTAAAWLRRAGQGEVWNLEGGLLHWSRLGLPLESPQRVAGR